MLRQNDFLMLWAANLPAPLLTQSVSNKIGFQSPLSVEVQPNPVLGPVKIKAALPREGAAKVELMDMTGWIWRTWNFEAEQGGEILWESDLAFLPKGFYFLRISFEGNERVRKTTEETVVRFLKV